MTWSGEEIDLDAYLARIGYEGDKGDLSPTIGTLRALQRAHVASIPFENLEVALGRPVLLDPKSVQAKLVGLPRGGYCYEQNSLFAAVLERLGFQIAGRGARNRTRGSDLTPVTHGMLVVSVDGERWLVDTGFGYLGPVEPVPIHDGATVEQGGWTFGIRVEEEGIHVLRTLRAEGWIDLYAFAPQTLYPADFAVMNHYSSSHPQSKFVGQVVAQLPGPGERHALVRDQLTTLRTDGSSSRRQVPSGELGRVLEDVFGIEMGAEALEQLGALTGGSQ
ncbi:arylamine N-acetyltransferase [Streptomyces sp. ISL-98]|uniref:arylamine N-acetyltransferase family protein n=1 Tax=Streptomyces sp. ISL-98 TaxID=2819192 RepID=UPI001BE98439|nr:arylamine N-acetyltransferase [Streptomyces sp. ISL-98]MBT2511145.1 arylamine N-acetyltransferase [Streptomyces sp. ISL-98]